MTDVIRSSKVDVSRSSWSGDKLKSKDFPLSKKRGGSHPLTRRYRWQVVTFSALGRQFRLLVAYHTEVPEFITTLGEDVGSDSRVLARWEFHLSHGGWHVHAACGEIDKLTPGIVKPLGTLRIPSEASYHRHTNLLNHGRDMDDATASVIASSLVGLPFQTDIFVQGAVPWL